MSMSRLDQWLLIYEKEKACLVKVMLSLYGCCGGAVMNDYELSDGIGSDQLVTEFRVVRVVLEKL